LHGDDGCEQLPVPSQVPTCVCAVPEQLADPHEVELFGLLHAMAFTPLHDGPHFELAPLPVQATLTVLTCG
jgi:hypothetical protein